MFTCRGRPAWPCEIKKIDRSQYTETKMNFNFLIILLWLLDLKNGEKFSCTPSISSSSTSHANAEHQRQHFPHLQLASPLCLAGFRMISDFHKLAWSADDLLMSGQLLPAMPVPQPTAKPFAPSSRAPATGLRKMSWSEAVQTFADIKLETSRNHMSFHLDLLKSASKLAVKIYPMLIFKTGIGFPRHHQKGGFMKNHGIQLKSAFYEIISFTLDGRSAHSLAVFLASCQCTIKASGQGLSRLRLFRVVSGYTDLSPKNETNTIKNDGKAGPPPGFSRLRNCCVTLLFCQFMPGCLVCNTMELPLWIHQSRQWFPSVLVSCAASDCSPAKEKLGHCSSVCWNWKKQIS